MPLDLERAYKKHGEYMRQRRALAREEGICTACLKESAEPGKPQCLKCSEYQRNYARRLKEEIIHAYGGCCACCGETDADFLQIDHISGNGNQHRKQLKREGTTFYRWLKKRGFPAGYQTYCANCNQAKGSGAACPHKIKERDMLTKLAKIPLTY